MSGTGGTGGTGDMSGMSGTGGQRAGRYDPLPMSDGARGCDASDGDACDRDAYEHDAHDGYDHDEYDGDECDHEGDGNGGDRTGRGRPTGGFGGDVGGEDELRQLLQARVRDLEPSPDALERLHRAVPARRQRRRHVVVGAAAALLFGGTSIPAMVHVAANTGGSTDRSANTASSQRAHAGTDGGHGEGTEQAGPRPKPGTGPAKPGDTKHPEKGKETEQHSPGQSAGAEAVPGVGGSPAPDNTMEIASPVCSRDQLGHGSSTVRPADSSGRVYGSFRVLNVSNAACSVEGGGAVGVVAQGSTNVDRIHVVDHTSGDDATGLPDPAATPGQLVLKPGEAYEVQFAWIPEAGGGPTGCVAPKPSPTPQPSKSPEQSADSGAGAPPPDQGSGQAGGDTGAEAGGATSGGIVLSHTPEAGEPAAADAKINDACAGTVYRTTALPTE
ncbi:hypothetical protein SSP35_05_04330 [Streptomyces sp. NBRC 110611]|uniref:hypothetical protein n=1 Tax=Streptomyces sp. NBRC 110611 TaxID=1621259 RepID=UPI0008568BF9|nr:hypothetical protein [Streptomyces sp. NBRC 110611]GAU67866.1 hypothetical protein SSP35_05_04330 [Streptomyces sp. NBRC 110611]